MVHINEKFIVNGETTIYSDIKENHQNLDIITSRTMMSPKNDTTDQVNEFVMNHIPGEAKILLSTEFADSNKAAMYPTEFHYCLYLLISISISNKTLGLVYGTG